MQQQALLHFAIFLMALNPLFAKFIDMPSLSIVWGRLFLTTITLGFIVRFVRKKTLKISKTETKWGIITGICFAIHWWSYFESIQISSVAIALCALFTYPIITGLLEPKILQKKYQKIDILGGIFVLAGVSIIVPEWNLENQTFIGIILGIISALCFSLRNLWSKKHLSNMPPDQTMFYHVLIGAILFFPLIFHYEFKPNQSDIGFLLLSGLLITPLSHSLYLKTFQYFSITTVSVTTSLQIIYASLLAFLFFQQIPDTRTLLGGAIILFTVISTTLLHKSNNK